MRLSVGGVPSNVSMRVVLSGRSTSRVAGTLVFPVVRWCLHLMRGLPLSLRACSHHCPCRGGSRRAAVVMYDSLTSLHIRNSLRSTALCAASPTYMLPSRSTPSRSLSASLALRLRLLSWLFTRLLGCVLYTGSGPDSHSETVSHRVVSVSLPLSECCGGWALVEGVPHSAPDCWTTEKSTDKSDRRPT